MGKAVDSNDDDEVDTCLLNMRSHDDGAKMKKEEIKTLMATIAEATRRHCPCTYLTRQNDYHWIRCKHASIEGCYEKVDRQFQ